MPHLDGDTLTYIVSLSGVALALIAGVVGRDRYLQKLIRDGDDRLRDAIEAGDERLHGRINDVREEMANVREEYVSKTEQGDFRLRLEAMMVEIKQDQREARQETRADLQAMRAEVNSRLDKLLAGVR